MVLVVCDSTPLIYLARIGRFELLRVLHEEILLPPAVWDEVAVEGAQFLEGQLLRKAVEAKWVRIETPRGSLHLLPGEVEALDPGEAEAIQLALERGALLAIDEAHGREVAIRFGLRVTGTVGFLIRARREGFISALRPELDRLRATTFRISQRIYEDALNAVGESSG